MALTENEKTIITIARRSSASISIFLVLIFLSLVLIFRVYPNFRYKERFRTEYNWKKKKYQHHHVRLVMYLSVSGAVSGISVLLGQVEDHTSACTFQAAWASFFDVSVIIWILILSIDFFNRIVKKKDLLSEYVYHLIVWPTSLIACVIPLFTGHYGKAGAWYVETNFTENSSVSLLKLSSFKVLDSQFCSSREIHSILHSPLHFLWYCGYFVHVKPFKKLFSRKALFLKNWGKIVDKKSSQRL